MREFFIKTFKDKKYAEAFLNNGEMLFRHFNYFRNIEDNKQRGDLSEGLSVETKKLLITNNVKSIQIGNNKIVKKFYIDVERLKKEKPDIFNKPLNFTLKYFADCEIYCITYLNSSTTNLDYIFDRIKKYGEYSVVITDCKNFLNKIKSNMLDYKFSLVKYSNEENGKDVFVKPIEYQFDSEFRIVKNNNKEKKLVNIGKLKGFVCLTRSIQIIKDVL